MLKICDSNTDPVLIKQISESIQTFTDRLKIRQKNQQDQKKKETLDVQLSVLESMMKMDGLIEDEIQKQMHETDAHN